MALPARSALLALLASCWLAATPARAETVILVDGSTMFSLGKGTSSLYGFPTVFDDSQPLSRQVTLSGDQITIEIGVPASLHMHFDIKTPTGTRFSPGNYPAAALDNYGVHPSDPTDWTSVNGNVNSNGCTTTEGWVKVHESEFGSDDSIVRLAFDFLQWCDFIRAPLFVAVRVNSAVPLTRPEPYAFAGLKQHATEGETVTLDAWDSYSYAASPLTYLWEQIEGPAVAIANPAARRTTFVAPVVPVGGVPLRFRLTVTDAENESDTDIITIQAHHPSDPRTRALIHSRIGDPIFQYWREVYSPNGLDSADLVQTLAESAFAMRGWVEGDSGLRIDMKGSFRPRRDRGVDLSATVGIVRGIFLAPWGHSPALGRYLNAQAVNPNWTTNPYMTFGGFALSCGDSTGAFEILELEFGGPPDPLNGTTTATKAAIDFVQQCAGATSLSPAITGSIRFNSAIPLHDGIVPSLPAAAPINAQLTISPNPAVVNQTVTFSWSAPNAAYCTGVNGIPQSPTEALPASGSVTTTYVAATTQQFWLRCFTSNSMGQDTETLTVNDASPPPPPPPPGGGGGGGGSMGFIELLAMLLGLLAVNSTRFRRAIAS
jgi:hypothetical protein